MKLKITITMDNAAFEESAGTEAARILAELADGLDGKQLPMGVSIRLADSNGNHVGEAKVTR